MSDLKIFISSPGDVPDERLRADLVVDKLSQDYSRFFTLSTYRWEHEPMLASGHFQDAITPPSATDILLLIVWSRLGTPLPAKTLVREYRGIDGRVPVTGTEWEYEDALAGARAHGSPEILAFRNTRPAPIDTCDADARTKSLAQLDALDTFWRRHFADRGVFIGAAESYDTLERFAHLLEQKLRKLIERRIATLVTPEGAAATSIWTGSPFRGLQAFEFEHAPIFFGRDAIVARAARHIAMAARHGEAFLLVAGASGSGKSSLVKAALVPRLMKPQRIEGLAFLRRIVFRPADAPDDIIHGVVEALVRDDRRAGVGLPELLAPGQSAADLARHLRASADHPEFVFGAALSRLTDDARRAGRILAHEQARAILVIDQLEELFTRETISATDRSLFVQLLAGLAKSGLVWVIATMRSDFGHRTADVPALLALAAGERRIDVVAPTPLELADMIRRPAEAAGLSFETDSESGIGLDAEIARRAATEPGILPLLSFTLEVLFAKDVVEAHGRVLTYATYKALGGLEGAIATRAEEIVTVLPAAAQAAVPRVLRALTTVSDGVDAIAVARTVPLDSFPPGTDARRVIDALTEGRLLVASGEGGRATVRVAHEALIGRWRRAEAQVKLDRRDLETRKLVEREFERWRTAKGPAQTPLLLDDPDLANAVDLDSRWGEDLQAEHRDFIARSAAAAQSAMRRRLVAASIVMFLLAALAALSVGGLAVAEMQRDDALIAQSRALARDAAAATAAGDTTLAMLLALAALPRSIAQPQRPFVLDAEYPLANAFANRRERAVVQHEAAINAIAFSPDGRRLGTASDDHTAIIWDAATGRRLVPLIGHHDHVHAIEFSHDGARVVTASADGTARVWDARTGRTIATLDARGADVFAASFSQNGTRVVATSLDGIAAIFDATSGARLSVLSAKGSNVVAAAFAPDGTKVATLSDDATTRIWTIDGALLHLFHAPPAQGTAVAFSHDGRRLLSAADDGTAQVWDTTTFAQVSALKGHAARISSAAFSPDGRTIVTASDDHTARIWNTETGTLVQALIGHDGIVYTASFSADGSRVLTGSEDRTARVWDVRNGFILATLGGHHGAVLSAVFASDGRTLATASQASIARLWNADTSATIAVLRGDTKPVVAAFSRDGSQIATGSDDGVLRLWDGRTGARIAAWHEAAQTIRSLAFSPDGRALVTGSADGTARIWTVATGAARILHGHAGAINAASFSPDGRLIVTASNDKTARIWDAATGAPLHTLDHNGSVTDAIFGARGGRLVTTSNTLTGIVWDVSSGRRIATLDGASGFVESVAVSPDGERIVTGSGQGAWLWNGATGAMIARLGPRAWIKAVAFSADGTMVATGGTDHAARLWNATDGTLRRTFTGHDLPVTSVAFSPDGLRLLTTSDDRTGRYWDVATGKTIAVLVGHEASVSSGAFAPGGALVMTASVDTTGRLWRLPPVCQALIDAERQARPRDLTAAERSHYFLESQDRGWSRQIHNLSAPVLALIVPTGSDVCR